MKHQTRLGILTAVMLIAGPALAQIDNAIRRAAQTFTAAASPSLAPQQVVPSISGVTVVDRPYERPDGPFPIAPAIIPVTAPTVAPVTVPVVANTPTWNVQIADINLSNTFRRWAGLAGYRVQWDANRHVLVDAPGEIKGSFEHAVERVLASPGIRNSEYPLEVCFYPNTPPLARVTRRGEQVKDCK